MLLNISNKNSKQKKGEAKWIMDPEFSKLNSINLFHKQKDKIEDHEHKEDLKNRHMLIRKSFMLKSVKENTYINITGDDYYKLYINGSFVGQGPTPSYHFAYNYNCFDITKYLIPGSNVIAVHVYYQGLVNRVWNSGDYRQGMMAEILEDGQVLLATDSTWKFKLTQAYQSGGTTGYETQFLENIDQRLWDPNWANIGYDDNDWLYVYEDHQDDHVLNEQASENLSVYEVKAKNVQKIKDNHYVIDFGQEITGQFLMEAQGKAGDQVEIRCGEELLEDPDSQGNYLVRYQLRCNCTYQEFWTLSGQKDRVNFYDYKAFRYVEVIAPVGVDVSEDFKAIVRHYPFDDRLFQFNSSNKLMDKIMLICKNGVKYGAQEVFVDCPTREKGQYLGDFTITGHSHIYLTGETKLYKKTLRDFANSTFICPGIMAVAPGAYMQEIADFSLQWPMQLYQYYIQTGDIEFLKEMYPYMVNLENYFKQYQRDDGLLVKVDEKWNLVDWPDNLRDGYDCELTNPIGSECHNVINAFYFGMMSYCDCIRETLDKKPTYDLEEFKANFNRVFFDETTHLFKDRENSNHSAIHSNALPLCFGLFIEEKPTEAIEFIKSRAHLCGVYMSYFVLKALAHVGEYNTIFNLIESLWSTMVNEGATTCFEAWGKDQKWNTSLCHPWASGAIPIMIEEIIGIKPETPGWENISFTPHIPEDLEYCCLELKVKTGPIKIEKKNGKITFQSYKNMEEIK